jgi:hypothetical protein
MWVKKAWTVFGFGELREELSMLPDAKQCVEKIILKLDTKQRLQVALFMNNWW